MSVLGSLRRPKLEKREIVVGESGRVRRSSASRAKVDAGVPIPKAARGVATRGARKFYGVDWAEMAVGDSCFFPGYGMGRPSHGLININLSIIRRFHPDKTWVARSTAGPDAEGDMVRGVRIWREA